MLDLAYTDGGRSKYFNFDAHDCVVRAIAIAENMDYIKAFTMVSREMGNSKKTPHDGVLNITLKKILKKLGYVQVTNKCKKMFKPHDLPINKKIIIHTKRHVCVFENMKTYDVFATKKNDVVHWYFIKDNLND